MRGFRLEHLLKRLLDENEFLSVLVFVPYQKYHKDHPYVFGIFRAITSFNMNQVKAVPACLAVILTGVAQSGCH
jgi:hypothetical protein